MAGNLGGSPPAQVSASTIADWLLDLGVATQEEISHVLETSGSLHPLLRDGFVLCNAANKLQLGPVLPKPNAKYKFEAVKNITSFLQCCRGTLPIDTDYPDPGTFYEGFDYEKMLGLICSLGVQTGTMKAPLSRKISTAKPKPPQPPPGKPPFRPVSNYHYNETVNNSSSNLPIRTHRPVPNPSQPTAPQRERNIAVPNTGYASPPQELGYEQKQGGLGNNDPWARRDEQRKNSYSARPTRPALPRPPPPMAAKEIVANQAQTAMAKDTAVGVQKQALSEKLTQVLQQQPQQLQQKQSLRSLSTAPIAPPYQLPAPPAPPPPPPPVPPKEKTHGSPTLNPHQHQQMQQLQQELAQQQQQQRQQRQSSSWGKAPEREPSRESRKLKASNSVPLEQTAGVGAGAGAGMGGKEPVVPRQKRPTMPTLPSLPIPISGEVSGDPTGVQTSASPPLEDVVQITSTRRAVALFPYAATKTDELTFKEGDIIELLTTPDDGWWEGKLGNAIGWFPTPYVEETTADTTTQQPIPQAPQQKTEGANTLLRKQTEVADESHINPEFRQETVDYLLRNEYDFVEDMEHFVENYLTPLRHVQGLPERSRLALCCNLYELTQFHEKLYAQMYEMDLGQLFVAIMPIVSAIHLKYSSMQPLALETFRKHRQDPAFAALLQEKATAKVPAALGFPVHLNKPTERIPLYEKVLKDLLLHTPSSHPDKRPLEQAVDMLDQLAAKCAHTRKMKEYERSVLYSGEVDGLSATQIAALGDLQYYVPIVCYNTRAGTQDALPKDRLLVVFPETLIVLKRTLGPGGRTSYKLKEKLAMASVGSARLDDSDMDNAFQVLYNSRPVITASAPSERERDDVVAALKSNHTSSIRRLPKDLQNEITSRDWHSTGVRGLRTGIKAGFKGALDWLAEMAADSNTGMRRERSLNMTRGGSVGNMASASSTLALANGDIPDFASHLQQKPPVEIIDKPLVGVVGEPMLMQSTLSLSAQPSTTTIPPKPLLSPKAQAPEVPVFNGTPDPRTLAELIAHQQAMLDQLVADVDMLRAQIAEEQRARRILEQKLR